MIFVLHWLIHDHLFKVNEISSVFASVGVSGVDDSCVLVGRLCGGCLNLYRKSLSSFITPLDSCSDRFCAIKVCDSGGLSILMICVYMPYASSQHSFDSY